jgi:hypothetical protein
MKHLKQIHRKSKDNETVHHTFFLLFSDWLLDSWTSLFELLLLSSLSLLHGGGILRSCFRCGVATSLMARIFVVSLEDFPTGRAIERDSQMVSGDVSLNASGFAELFIASLEGAAEFTWRCYVASLIWLAINPTVEAFELTCISIHNWRSCDIEKIQKIERAESPIWQLEGWRMRVLKKQDFRVMEPLLLKIRCQEKMVIEKSLVKVVLEEFDELSWEAMKHVQLPRLQLLIQNRVLK